MVGYLLFQIMNIILKCLFLKPFWLTHEPFQSITLPYIGLKVCMGVLGDKTHKYYANQNTFLEVTL